MEDRVAGHSKFGETMQQDFEDIHVQSPTRSNSSTPQRINPPSPRLWGPSTLAPYMQTIEREPRDPKWDHSVRRSDSTTPERPSLPSPEVRAEREGPPASSFIARKGRSQDRDFALQR